MVHCKFLKAATAAALIVATGVAAAKNHLKQVTADFGPNPNGVGMFVYEPDKLAKPLPLIVAIHQCYGSAQNYFSCTQYANLADKYGFIVVYPNSTGTNACFDGNNAQTLSHNGGGDSQGIASMISYAISKYKVSPEHVSITGFESGAMMANVMAGSYPNLFQAASVYSGIPFGCSTNTETWNTTCIDGTGGLSGTVLGDVVRAAYPGYTGPRPKMMFWQGNANQNVSYDTLFQEVAQWTNVLNITDVPTATVNDEPQEGYITYQYGSNVVAINGTGVNPVPVHEAVDLSWFGITNGTATSTGPESPAASCTITLPFTYATHYGQCGGLGWTGPTLCPSPWTCVVNNEYFSQCL